MVQKHALVALCQSAVALLLIMACTVAPVRAAQLACPDFAPFKMAGMAGQRPGIDIEVLQAVFSRIGEPVTFLPMPWKRALEQARAGRVDGLCGCSYLPERENEFLFSDKLGYHHQGLFSPAEAPLPPETRLADLAARPDGRPVGVVRGYTLENQLSGAGVAVLNVVDDAQLVRVLANNRVDAVYAFRDVLRFYEKAEGLGETFVYTPVGREPYFVCLSRAAPGAEALLGRINRGLATVRADGTYDRIWQSYGAQP